MTTTITTAMISALARLRQRVSYVLMRGGDDAPLRLAVDSVGDVVLILAIPEAAEPAELGYVWEEDGDVLYEPDAGGTDDGPLDSEATADAVCEAAVAAIAAELGGGCEPGRTESGDWVVTTPGGYIVGSLGMSRSLAEIMLVGRARLRDELAAEISESLMACHPAAAGQAVTDAWPQITIVADDGTTVLAAVDYADDATSADDAVALTGPDGDRTVLRPDSYMLLCQEDWEDHVRPVCDAVAAALTAG